MAEEAPAAEDVDNPSRIPPQPYGPTDWDTFEALFRPIKAPNGSWLWDLDALPETVEPREWWTVLDTEGELVVVAGFRFVNRFAYIRCRQLWDGAASEHPCYTFD